MLSVSPADFRSYANLDSAFTDEQLNPFILAGLAFVSRLCGKSLDDLPSDDAELQLAVMLTALNLWNSRDFPNRTIDDAIKQKVLNLIAGNIDLAGRLILTESTAV